MPRQSLPSIPQVPKGLPPEQTRFLQALADACRIRFGQTKNEVDRSVTVGELEGTGIIVRNGSNVAAGVVTGDGNVVTTGGNSAAFTDQTTPSAPTGLTVGTPDSTTVLLNWDPPTDTQDYIAYAEVFRSINDDFDVYETNEDTGSTTANDVVFVGTGAYGFADHFEQGSAPTGGYYYFVRWRTYADNAGAAAESGAVIPALDPANLLAALSEADADDALVFDEISEFIVKADTFKIRSPDVGGNAIGDLIFAVDTQNNQVVMDGAYIKALTVTNAQIANTTIGTAQIDTIAGNKITVGTLEADRIILDGAVLGTYDNNGTIELTVNGIRLNTTNAAGENVLQDESGNALSDTTVLNTNTTWAQVLLNGGNNLPTENLVGQGATNPTASNYSLGDFWYNTTDNAFYVLLLVGTPTPVETWVKWGDVTAENIPQDIQDGADAGTGLVEGTTTISEDSVGFTAVAQYGGVYWGPIAPANPTTQAEDEYAATIWIDTSTIPYTSKYWNGTAWVIGSTVGAQTGASGNLIDENGVPIVDATATNRQQQALGILGQRIAFETGSLSYVAHEDGTDLYINQSKTLSQADSADTGTISVTAGDIITSNRPVSLHNESGYPIPSIAHTGYKFITHTNRGTTQRFKIYAPFAAGIIKYAQEAAPGGQSIGSHVDWAGNNGTVTWSSTGVPFKTVTTIDISTTDNTAIYHIFYSDTPIVMVKWTTDNQDFAWVPRTENEVVGARTAAFASFTADPVSSITGTTEGAKYYYALSPIGAISNQDGSGSDADHYVPINALGDTYYIHHAIAGFQIVALEATTIKAEYWSGTAWTSYATYDLEDATRADIGEAFVGSLSAGSSTATALQSGAAPWRFIGSGRFYIRTNDTNGDEYPVIGYWSELRTWDINPQAGDIDFADLGGVKPPADANRNLVIDYTFATELARTNASTTSFSGGEIAFVTETSALWLWDGAGSGWVAIATIGGILGSGGNIFAEDGTTNLTDVDLINTNVTLNDDGSFDYTGAGTGISLSGLGFGGALDATNNTMGSGTAFPTNPAPSAGDLFYRTDEKKLYEYNGSTWENWATLNTGELADKDSVDYTTGEVTNTPTSLTDINIGEFSSLQSITSIPLVIPAGNNQTVTQVGLDIQSSGNQSTGNWSTQFYSKDASVGGCAVSFTIGSTTSRYMIGLNSDPATNASYSTIDYCWYVRGNTGDYVIFESGSVIQSGGSTVLFGSITAGDVLTISWDGTTIRYMLNGVVERSVVPATQPSSLALDSSIDGIGSQHTTIIKNINFINIGATLPTLGTNVLAEDGSTLLSDEDLRNSALDVSTTGSTLSVTYGANTSTGVNLDASSNIDNALYYTAGATEFTGEIDATHNSILASAATDPTGQAGEFYYNTADKEWKYYDGSAWVAVSTFNSGALADKDAVDLGTSEVTGTLGTANADTGLINTNVTLTNSGSTLSLTGGNAATVTLDASIVDNVLARTGGGTYTGDLAATAGATWGTDVDNLPPNLSSLTGTEGIENSAIDLDISGTTFGLSGAGSTTYTLDQSNVGLTGVQDYATISTASNAINKDPFFNNRAAWSINSDFTYTTTTSSPAAGNTILQGTRASGGDNEFFSEVMPLDPSKPYKITVWARQTAGNRHNYLTVRFLDVNEGTINTSGNATGWPSAGTYWYWGVINDEFPSAWTRYEIHFGGSHGPIIPTSARYVRIGALCLRSTNVTSPTSSTIEFAQYTIEEAQTDITVIPNALQYSGGGTYSGDLAATAGATWGTDVDNLPPNLSGLAGTEEIQNANIDYSSDGSGTLPAAQGGTGLTSTSTLENVNVELNISGQTFGLSGAGATTYTLDQSNVGLTGVQNNADQTSLNQALSISGQGALATQSSVALGSQVSGTLAEGSGGTGLTSTSTLQNVNVSINADGTLGGAGAGQVTAPGLGVKALVGTALAGTAVVTGNKLTMSGLGNGWNKSWYSNEGYVSGCFCSGTCPTTSAVNLMMGLNSDPTGTASWTNLDYAWHWANGNIYIYESGSQVLSSGAYNSSTVATIIYTGSAIKYYLNGSLEREVTTEITNALYLDCAFYENAARSIENLTFGPISSNRWADIAGTGTPADNADVTSANTAAGITGQGALATQNSVTTEQVPANSRGNLQDISGWTAASSTVASGWGANGGETQNEMIVGLGPRYGYQVLWQANSTSTVANTANGGWGSSPRFTPDQTKTYRFVVPIQASSSTRTGTAYWGIEANKVADLNTTTTQGNPYFAVINRSSMTTGQWYLFVGYVYPYNTTGWTHDGSGVYEMATGTQISTYLNFNWINAPGTVNTRAYMYYCSSTADRQLFAPPIIHLVDGSEPPLNSFFATTAYQNNNLSLSTSGQTLQLNNGGGNTTLDQGNVGLSGVTNNADQTSANTAANISGQGTLATSNTVNLATTAAGGVSGQLPAAYASDTFLNDKGYQAFPITETNSNRSYTWEGNSLYVSGGTNGTWNYDVHSVDGFQACYVKFKPGQTDKFHMLGLNSDPGTSGDYNDLDFAWYPAESASLNIYENGTSIGSYGSYSTSTVLSITWDGSQVKYYKDGVLQRNVPFVSASPLYFDSSFYRSTGTRVNALEFGPLTPNYNNSEKGGVTNIAVPIGGTYSYNGNITGQIRIFLPAVGNLSTMMNFEVDIYNYVTGTSSTYLISGHTSGTTWYQEAASCPNGSLARQVTFGYGSSRWQVGIGATNATWSYPQIRVRNCTFGYSSYGVDNWDDGWAVDISSSSIEGVTRTVSDSRANANWQLVGGTGVPADNADVTSANNALGIANQGALATANTVNLETTGAGGVSGLLPTGNAATGLRNTGVNLSISGQTFGLSGAGTTSYTVNQGNVGLSGVTNNADQTSGNIALGITGQAASATTDTTNAANISTGALPNGRYSAAGVAQYAPLAGALNKNPYFQYDGVDWPASGTPGNGLSIVYSTDTTSPSGSNSVFYYQDNASGDNSFFTDRIPIDPDQPYTITVWARQAAGNKRNYITCWFEDASQNTLLGSNSPTGWPAAGTYHYWGVVNSVFPSTWTKYEISIGGANVTQIPPGAVTVRIGLLALRATGVTSPTSSSLYLAEYSIREGDPRATNDTYTEGQVTNIASPGGGIYGFNGNITGCLHIELPANVTTMISFEVDIYNYVTNKSVTYRITGHTSGVRWYEYSASNPYGALYHKVRFGRNLANTRWAVQIGDTNSSWSYPQLRVRNVTVGYANYDAKLWSSNWVVNMYTSNIVDGNGAATLVQEIADTRGNANWQLVGGTGVPADNADVTSANNALGIANQGALATQNSVTVSQVPASTLNTNVTTYTLDRSPTAVWSALSSDAQVSGPTAPYDVTIQWRDGSGTSLGTTVIRMSYSASGTSISTTSHTQQSNGASASVSLNSTNTSSRKVTTVTKNSVTVTLESSVINGISWTFSK